LAILNLGLSLLFLRIWTHGQARVRAPERMEVTPLALPDLGPLDSSPMRSVEVAAIRDQSLFYATRSFYQPPAKPQDLPAPNYELAGTMRLPGGKRVAFVRSKVDQSSRAVHVGDSLEGWIIATIEPERVALTQLEQTLELASAKPLRAPGLVRSSPPVRTGQTGIRKLGGDDSAVHALNAVANATGSAPRVFVPPIPIGK